MPIPSDQLPIGEGLDPAGNAGASFFVDRNALELIEQDGPEWKMEDARFIPEAVREPDAVFQGLKRAGQEESFAYAVRPSHDPDDENATFIPPHLGFVLVAFARTGVGGYVVFDWEWREEDPDNPGHPLGWEADFERATWRRT